MAWRRTRRFFRGIALFCLMFLWPLTALLFFILGGLVVLIGNTIGYIVLLPVYTFVYFRHVFKSVFLTISAKFIALLLFPPGAAVYSVNVVFGSIIMGIREARPDHSVRHNFLRAHMRCWGVVIKFWTRSPLLFAQYIARYEKYVLPTAFEPFDISIFGLLMGTIGAVIGAVYVTIMATGMYIVFIPKFWVARFCDLPVALRPSCTGYLLFPFVCILYILFIPVYAVITCASGITNGFYGAYTQNVTGFITAMTRIWVGALEGCAEHGSGG